MGTVILTPNGVKADNSDFDLYLETPFDLNPKLEWEAAIIDGYIPVKSDVKVVHCFAMVIVCGHISRIKL